MSKITNDGLTQSGAVDDKGLKSSSDKQECRTIVHTVKRLKGRCVHAHSC